MHEADWAGRIERHVKETDRAVVIRCVGHARDAGVYQLQMLLERRLATARVYTDRSFKCDHELRWGSDGTEALSRLSLCLLVSPRV